MNNKSKTLIPILITSFMAISLITLTCLSGANNELYSNATDQYQLVFDKTNRHFDLSNNNTTGQYVIKTDLNNEISLNYENVNEHQEGFVTFDNNGCIYNPYIANKKDNNALDGIKSIQVDFYGNDTIDFEYGYRFNEGDLKYFEKVNLKSNQIKTFDFYEPSYFRLSNSSLNKVYINSIKIIYSCSVGETPIDYTHHSNVKLTREYKGNKIIERDGIEQVDLRLVIDGDSYRFYNRFMERSITVRASNIDTPESTAVIEPYGKAAYQFAKDILTKANKDGTIVISSLDYIDGPAHPDSTGSRYICLVWVNENKKDAPIDELYCLNLAIIENGYSDFKGQFTILNEFNETFILANEKARAMKLNIHSGVNDPEFDESYKPVSLMRLHEEQLKLMKDRNANVNFNGKNVIVMGAVSGYSNNVLYIQDNYLGQPYGINIFTGMAGLPSEYRIKNTYVEIHGTCYYSDSFGYQISNVNYKEIIYKAEENIATHCIIYDNYTSQQINDDITSNTYDLLNRNVNLNEELTVSHVYCDYRNQITLGMENQKFVVRINFPYHGYPDKPNDIWDREDDFLNKRFLVKETVYTARPVASTTYRIELVVLSQDDLVFIG